MKRLAPTLLLLALCAICLPALAAQKISSLDLDMTPLPSAKQRIPGPTMPAAAPPSGGLTLPNSPVTATPKTNAVDWDSPSLMPSSSSMIPAAPSLSPNKIQNKPLDISVPSYEKEYQEMMERERAAQEAKKKRTFLESLTIDLQRHGLLLLLAFVILLVVYALRKERTPVKPVGKEEQPFEPQEPSPPKDIWHENF